MWINDKALWLCTKIKYLCFQNVLGWFLSYALFAVSFYIFFHWLPFLFVTFKSIIWHTQTVVTGKHFSKKINYKFKKLLTVSVFSEKLLAFRWKLAFKKFHKLLSSEALDFHNEERLCGRVVLNVLWCYILKCFNICKS